MSGSFGNESTSRLPQRLGQVPLGFCSVNIILVGLLLIELSFWDLQVFILYVIDHLSTRIYLQLGFHADLQDPGRSRLLILVLEDVGHLDANLVILGTHDHDFGLLRDHLIYSAPVVGPILDLL